MKIPPNHGFSTYFGAFSTSFWTLRFGVSDLPPRIWSFWHPKIPVRQLYFMYFCCMLCNAVTEAHAHCNISLHALHEIHRITPKIHPKIMDFGPHFGPQIWHLQNWDPQNHEISPQNHVFSMYFGCISCIFVHRYMLLLHRLTPAVTHHYVVTLFLLVKYVSKRGRKRVPHHGTPIPWWFFDPIFTKYPHIVE